MIGFLVGTACLIGLVKVLRGGRRFGHHGWGYGGGWGGGWGGGRSWGGGCHHGGGHGCHGHHEGRGGGFGGPPWAGRRGGGFGGFGPKMALRWLFEQLDTTPGQEKVILSAVEDVRAAGSTARETLQKARADVAKAMRGDVVDEVLLAEASARLDVAGQAMREVVSVGLTKIHGALDAEQRARFADLIADGPGFFRGFAGHGPYRGGMDI